MRTPKRKKTPAAKRKRLPKRKPELYKRKDRDELKAELVTLDPSAGHVGRKWFGSQQESFLEDLPIFRLRHAQLMMFDPVVRFGLNVRDAALMAAKITIDGDNQEVTQFLGEQWKTIWGKFGSKILKTKRWGFSGFQVEYSIDNATGNLIVDDLKDFSPYDVRPLKQGNNLIGFRLQKRTTTIRPRSQSEINILRPRGLWTTFDAEQGRNFGRPILRRSFGPWWEKWMDHGYKKTAQLRMMKDAARGDSFTYPPDRLIQLPDGSSLPWRDVVRDIAESSMNGSTLVYPSLFDNEGHELVKYTPPKDTGNPQGIWEWGEKLDRDIWRGCDVFEEVIQASQTGSGYSGRSVPLMMFLQACMLEFSELLQSIDRDILRPLAWLNFGIDPEYQVRPVPLVETFAEATQGSAMGGGAMGGPASAGPEQQGGGIAAIMSGRSGNGNGGF